MKMVILTISCILPPAASTTVCRLRNTCSYWATISPGATMRPSASLAVCPARNSNCPSVTMMPWLKPVGRAKFGGLMMLFPIVLPSCKLWLLFCLKCLIKVAMIFAHQQQSLGLRLRLDSCNQVHIHFAVEHMFGHG